jgi:NhaP-type Na+/H+ or K+/H+ antiporter
MLSGVAIFTLFIVIYALLSVWLGKRSITMPIFFVAIGALTGPYGFNWLNISLSSETVKVLVEITLALLLFAD